MKLRLPGSAHAAQDQPLFGTDAQQTTAENPKFATEIILKVPFSGNICATINYADAISDGLREASAKVAAKAIPQMNGM